MYYNDFSDAVDRSGLAKMIVDGEEMNRIPFQPEHHGFGSIHRDLTRAVGSPRLIVKFCTKHDVHSGFVINELEYGQTKVNRREIIHNELVIQVTKSWTFEEQKSGWAKVKKSILIGCLHRNHFGNTVGN